jgi:hypothetical protein
MSEQSKWPRRVTVQVEIIEERENAPALRLIFDKDYDALVLYYARKEERHVNSRLYKVLHDVLDKYQPRGTIEGSIQQTREIEGPGAGLDVEE